MKIVTAGQMQHIDRQCADAGLPTDVLMENAGRAVAEESRRIVGTVDRSIVFLVGPGNNGGDGLVAARYLHDWGSKVVVYLCAPRPEDDHNLRLVGERGIAVIDAAGDENLGRLDELLGSATAVVDALFGTGRSRQLQGIFVPALERVGAAQARQPRLRIIALDLPSGLDADTGAADPACLYADNTITLGFPKLGLFSFTGAEHAGAISVVDIGIPAHLAEGIDIELMTDRWAGSALPGRPLWANKGSFGRVLVVAGSVNYVGAAYLACTGAIRVGAGLVTLATPGRLQPVLASKLTEVTYLPLPDSSPGAVSAGAATVINRQLDRYNALLLGCGLGQSRGITRFVTGAVLRSRKGLPSLVVDADGLNALAQVRDWWRQLAGDAILTPHPGEMARLTGKSVDEVQQDRVGVARKSAAGWNKTVVLKGAYTVIAAADGKVKISPFVNPGLASAGTGDVLSGAIAGLVAQGLSLFDAAALGVYLHGRAGEMVRARLGDAGMIAGDLLPELPLAIKQLRGV